MPFIEEHEAAALLAAGLANIANEYAAATGITTHAGSKREREAQVSDDDEEAFIDVGDTENHKPKKKAPPRMNELDPTGLVFAQSVARPAPYFYYTDHSLEDDEDPFTPITAAGHVPCFPAKMHAILSNPELSDIVAWAPHGRSWRILKPRQFECYVLPRYFEHSKFSSFVRQANGWGFRRFAQGMDRNAYYQEYFLRSMPWLCKKMRRPKVGEKKSIGSGMEPDLSAISKEFPVPSLPVSREIQVVLETIKKGPRARMPVHWATDHLPSARETRAMPTLTTTYDMSSKPSAMASRIMNSPYESANDAFNPHQPPVDSRDTQPSSFRKGDVMNTPNDVTYNENQINTNRNGNSGNDYEAGFKAASQYHNDQINSLRQALIRGVSITTAFNALNRDTPSPGAANLNEMGMANVNQGGMEDYLRLNQVHQMQAMPNQMQLLQDQIQAMHNQLQLLQDQMMMMPNHNRDPRDRFNVCDAPQGNQNEDNNGMSARVTDYLHLLQVDEMNQFNIGSAHGCMLHQGDDQGNHFGGKNNFSSFQQLQDGTSDRSETRMDRW